MRPAKLTPKGEQTRRRIAAAAAELMVERGVVGTTLEDVREVAGVSSSQIYHYFADKQALVRAVVEHQTEAVVGRQEGWLADLRCLDDLRGWRDGLVAYQRSLACRGGCPIGSLGSELAEIDQSSRIDIAAGFHRWEIAIRRCFHAMHASGELVATADPEELALATLAALQGGLLLTQIQRDTKPLEAALDAMLSLVGSLTRNR